jgi:hypothetical protein
MIGNVCATRARFRALVFPDTWHLRPDTFFTPSPIASPTRGATNPSR